MTHDTRRKAGDCPSCGGVMDTVDSRPTDRPEVLRRRRKCCRDCGYRCTTHEIIVADDLGYANGIVRRTREFVKGVEALAHETFGPEGGFMRAEGKSKGGDT